VRLQAFGSGQLRDRLRICDDYEVNGQLLWDSDGLQANSIGSSRQLEKVLISGDIRLKGEGNVTSRRRPDDAYSGT